VRPVEVANCNMLGAGMPQDPIPLPECVQGLSREFCLRFAS